MYVCFYVSRWWVGGDQINFWSFWKSSTLPPTPNWIFKLHMSAAARGCILFESLRPKHSYSRVHYLLAALGGFTAGFITCFLWLLCGDQSFEEVVKGSCSSTSSPIAAIYASEVDLPELVICLRRMPRYPWRSWPWSLQPWYSFTIGSTPPQAIYCGLPGFHCCLGTAPASFDFPVGGWMLQAMCILLFLVLMEIQLQSEGNVMLLWDSDVLPPALSEACQKGCGLCVSELIQSFQKSFHVAALFYPFVIFWFSAKVYPIQFRRGAYHVNIILFPS